VARRRTHARTHLPPTLRIAISSAEPVSNARFVDSLFFCTLDQTKFRSVSLAGAGVAGRRATVPSRRRGRRVPSSRIMDGVGPAGHKPKAVLRGRSVPRGTGSILLCRHGCRHIGTPPSSSSAPVPASFSVGDLAPWFPYDKWATLCCCPTVQRGVCAWSCRRK
jgi:hypothetical protein